MVCSTYDILIKINVTDKIIHEQISIYKCPWNHWRDYKILQRKQIVSVYENTIDDK